MSKSRTLMSRRIEDAHRVRGLWAKHVQDNPDVPEADRIRIIHQEVIRRSPAGTFLYLASFRESEPSLRWLTMVLRGRLLGRGRDHVELGPSMLTTREREGHYQRAPFSRRLEAVEQRLNYIARNLGIEFDENPADN